MARITIPRQQQQQEEAEGDAGNRQQEEGTTLYMGRTDWRGGQLADGEEKVMLKLMPSMVDEDADDGDHGNQQHRWSFVLTRRDGMLMQRTIKRTGDALLSTRKGTERVRRVRLVDKVRKNDDVYGRSILSSNDGNCQEGVWGSSSMERSRAREKMELHKGKRKLCFKLALPPFFLTT